MHYCCFVGHSFNDRQLLIRISEVMESTFWTSLRMMEERRSLLLKLQQNTLEKGYSTIADMHIERVQEMEVYINNLKQILFNATHVD